MSVIIVVLCFGMVREPNPSLHIVLKVLFIITAVEEGRFLCHLSSLALSLWRPSLDLMEALNPINS